jgi:HEAT repeat protein
MTAGHPGGAAELARELRATGVPVSDIWQLVNGKVQYRQAIPVLIDWLEHVDERVPGPERAKVTEALARALTVPAARPAATPVLINAFRRVSDPSGMGLRWVIGNALSVVADDSVFDDVAALARDRGYGKGRQMVVLGLGRSSDPRAVPILLDLLNDEDVAAHAVTALGKLKATAARERIRSLLDHPQALVRREAKKALAKIPP